MISPAGTFVAPLPATFPFLLTPFYRYIPIPSFVPCALPSLTRLHRDTCSSQSTPCLSLQQHPQTFPSFTFLPYSSQVNSSSLLLPSPTPSLTQLPRDAHTLRSFSFTFLSLQLTLSFPPSLFFPILPSFFKSPFTYLPPALSPFLTEPKR